jgi:hypothetical protein
MYLDNQVTFNTLVAREAKKVIEKMIEDFKEELVHSAYSDEAQYKVTCGKIFGLRGALQALGDAEAKILKG